MLEQVSEHKPVKFEGSPEDFIRANYSRAAFQFPNGEIDWNRVFAAMQAYTNHQLAQLRQGAGPGPRCPKCGSAAIEMAVFKFSREKESLLIDCEDCSQHIGSIDAQEGMYKLADFAQFFPAQGWVKVSETSGVPAEYECKEVIIGWADENKVATGFQTTSYEWCDSYGKVITKRPSHWRPLPEITNGK